MRTTLLLLTISLAWVGAKAESAVDATASASVASPDGKLEVTINVSDGTPIYRVTREGQTIVSPSKLGFAGRTKTEFNIDTFINCWCMRETTSYEAFYDKKQQADLTDNLAITATVPARASSVADEAWYTLSGIRLKEPKAKGMYLHHGKIVVIK